MNNHLRFPTFQKSKFNPEIRIYSIFIIDLFIFKLRVNFISLVCENSFFYIFRTLSQKITKSLKLHRIIKTKSRIKKPSEFLTILVKDSNNAV